MPGNAAPTSTPMRLTGDPQDQKGARRRGAWIVFQDESGFSLLPAVRATWAPRGRKPVLTHRFSWTRMSMAGALAYRPDRSQAVFVFQIRNGSYNTESLIAYLTDLRKHLRGQPVILVWDGLSAHRSAADEGMAGHPTRLAARRGAARLRPRPQPDGTGLGQRQSPRTGQPLPRPHRRSPHRSRNRPAPSRTQLPAVLQLPCSYRPFPLTTSPKYRKIFNSDPPFPGMAPHGPPTEMILHRRDRLRSCLRRR